GAGGRAGGAASAASDPGRVRTGEGTAFLAGPGGRARAGEGGSTMYRTILVPLDGSPLAERAVPYAQRLAAATVGRVVLLRVVGGPGREPLRGSAPRREAEAYLHRLAERRGAPPVDPAVDPAVETAGRGGGRAAAAS